jgi:antitoxin PrlF
METSIVTTKGQIVIPAKIRKRYDIKEGTKVHFVEAGSKIIMEPVTGEFYKKLQGSLKGSGVVQSLLEERKKDRMRE